MTKLAPEWVRTSDPVIRSPARYRWTTAPASCEGERSRLQILHAEWKSHQNGQPSPSSLTCTINTNVHLVNNVNNVQLAPSVIKHCKEHIPLKIIYCNAQGLYNNFFQLTDLVAEEDPDVIAITETWLDSTIGDTEFTPGGYTTFRKDRDIQNYPVVHMYKTREVVYYF